MEGFVAFLFVVAVVGWFILRAVQDQQLLKENPQAWAAKKMVEQQEKERKQRAKARGALVGFQIARMFLPKF